jgi:chromosome segregation ATPase
MHSYFNDANRELQKQSSARQTTGTTSNVQLPPLRADSGSPSTSLQQTDENFSWQQASESGVLQRSTSAGGLEFTADKAARGIQDQRYQQALQENSRLSRRLRAMQDQLSITTAKKDAFRAQATRLEKEFKKSREQMDDLQKDLLEAKRKAETHSTESTEAIKMMNEMRQAHLQEVRLLQRGLEARAGDEKFRNRVNEVADLVDKLGRAVVQRDESVRERQKAEAQSGKMIVDLRALADECSKLRRQNKSLESRLKEAVRKGKGAFKPSLSRQEAELDDSDEEFEVELLHFEKRFKILEEGPMGLDILASNLARDKRLLEKALKQSQEAHRATSAALEEWKALSNDKDKTITTQNQKIEEMMMAQAALEEEIERKRREVEESVNAERTALEERMAKLQADYDEARQQADDLVLQSDKLSQELVKAHELYDEDTKKAQKRREEAKKDLEEPAPEEESGEWTAMDEEEVRTIRTKADVERQVTLKIQVEEHSESSKMRFRVSEPDGDGKDTFLQLPEYLQEELATKDGWDYSRIGLSAAPDEEGCKIVISEQMARDREVSCPPNSTSVLCNVYRFDAMRYYVTGVNLAEGLPSDIIITKDELQKDKELCGFIESGIDRKVVDHLLSKLTFTEQGLGLALTEDAELQKTEDA